MSLRRVDQATEEQDAVVARVADQEGERVVGPELRPRRQRQALDADAGGRRFLPMTGTEDSSNSV